MSTEKTTSTRKRVLRKATFTTEVVKGVKVFHPVNKRAHKLARKVGKRTRLFAADIKAVKALGKAKVYAYNSEGVLRFVR